MPVSTSPASYAAATAIVISSSSIIISSSLMGCGFLDNLLFKSSFVNSLDKFKIKGVFVNLPSSSLDGFSCFIILEFGRAISKNSNSFDLLNDVEEDVSISLWHKRSAILEVEKLFIYFCACSGLQSSRFCVFIYCSNELMSIYFPASEVWDKSLLIFSALVHFLWLYFCTSRL